MIDLEDAIYIAWQTSKDIDLLYQSQVSMTPDQIANTLLGIHSLHEMRMEKLHERYRQAFKLDEFTTDKQKLANRKKLLKVIDQINKAKGKTK